MSVGLDAPDRGIETTLKIRQLVYFNEVIKQDFNISAAAQALYTSQPSVSRQLRELADELGVEIFRYQGKRLIGLIEAGAEIARITARVLMEVRRIQEVVQTYGAGRRNRIKVVATRHAASNLLHRAMVLAREQLPTLQVEVTEEDPRLATAMLRAGEADLGLLTEVGRHEEDLIYFPIERWQLLLVAPRGHPLCDQPSIGLLDLTHYAICSYEHASRSRQVIDETFERAGLQSPVTLSFASSRVILQYVQSQIGVAIIAESAFDPLEYQDLRGISVSHLFRPMTTEVVMPRKTDLLGRVCAFVHILAPELARDEIEKAGVPCALGAAARVIPDPRGLVRPGQAAA